MSNEVDFLLPDELGWECNDKLSILFGEYAVVYSTLALRNEMGAMKACVAEFTDKSYSIIKEYQALKKSDD